MAQGSQYWGYFALSAQQTLASGAAKVGGLLLLLVTLALFCELWERVLESGAELPMGSAHIVWYFVLNEWLLISLPDVHEKIESHVQSGALCYHVSRPTSYLLATFLEALGVLFVNLLFFGAFAFAFGIWRSGGAFLPAGTLLVVGVATLLAGALAILLRMLIGLAALWHGEVRSLYVIWETLLFLCGGILTPLICYPDWLRYIAYSTPFSSLMGMRSSLIFDASAERVLLLFGSYLFWVSLGVVLLRAVYVRGMRAHLIAGG